MTNPTTKRRPDISDKEYESAEDEAYARATHVMQEWDSTLGDIEEKWGLPRGESLDEYCLTFKGH